MLMPRAAEIDHVVGASGRQSITDAHLTWLPLSTTSGSSGGFLVTVPVEVGVIVLCRLILTA